MAKAIIFKDFSAFKRYVICGHESEGCVSFQYERLTDAKGGGLCFTLKNGKHFIVNNRQLIALEGAEG